MSEWCKLTNRERRRYCEEARVVEKAGSGEEGVSSPPWSLAS
jgi:hypothetical protein